MQDGTPTATHAHCSPFSSSIGVFVRTTFTALALCSRQLSGCLLLHRVVPERHEILGPSVNSLAPILRLVR